MRMLILTQKYPMGNYLLNQRVAEHYEGLGYKVLILPQIYLSEKGFAQYIETISNFKPDVLYYEMLDKDTFTLVSMMKCEKILVLASLGIFGHLGADRAIEELKNKQGKYYTKIYTNSLLLYDKFKDFIRCEHFKYYFSPIRESEKMFDEKYNHNLVFLGMGYQRTQKQSKEKEIFFDNLKDNKDFAIYGSGWTKDQYPCYRGLLPSEDIGKLYTSAKAGIAMIQEQQASLGMINNRYIEMMSCGLPIYSLYYNDINFYEGKEFITFVDSNYEINSVVNNPLPIYLQVNDKKRDFRAMAFAERMSLDFFKGLDKLFSI